ncbi:MAG: aminotransferase class I/II-fold pyridoxal phosphate-dependent enzyme, partial [Bacteroidota bacterium]
KYSNMDGTELYVVTESVFSMDGDSPDLKSLVALCETYAAKLVIDEAHALGVHGEHGSGLLQELKIENGIFARIITFGKALGCHGAAVLGSQVLKDYLINFCRPFIYTTALPPHTLATLIQSYTVLKDSLEIKALRQNIDAFNSEKIHLGLEDQFIKSQSAIHCCIVPGNDAVKDLALNLQNQGFDVKPILSPTVSQGRERLRFCLHSYNSEGEISEVLRLLATFAFS